MKKLMCLYVTILLNVCCIYGSDEQEIKKNSASLKEAQHEHKHNAEQQKVTSLIKSLTQRQVIVQQALEAECSQLPQGLRTLILEYQKQPLHKKYTRGNVVDIDIFDENMGRERCIHAVHEDTVVAVGNLCYSLEHHNRLLGIVFKHYTPYRDKQDNDTMICVLEPAHLLHIDLIRTSQLQTPCGLYEPVRLPNNGAFVLSKFACLPKKGSVEVIAIQQGRTIESGEFGSDAHFASEDHLVVMDMKTGKLVKRLQIPNSTGTCVEDMVACDDGTNRYVACYLSAKNPTVDKDGVIKDTVVTFNLSKSQHNHEHTLASVPRVQGHKKIASALDKDGNPIIIVPKGSDLLVFNMNNGTQTTTLNSSNKQPVLSCNAQKVGDVTVIGALKEHSADSGSTADLWDLTTGELIVTNQMNDECLDIALTENGQLVTYTRSADDKATRCDLISWKLEDE